MSAEGIKLKGLEDFRAEVISFIQDQPPGNDLDQCDEFLRALQSIHATLAQKVGEAETLFNRCVVSLVKNEYEEYKKVKSSSTLTIAYVAGRYARYYSVWQDLKRLERLIFSTYDNYRTLLSSHKREFMMSQKSVNQR